VFASIIHWMRTLSSTTVGASVASMWVVGVIAAYITGGRDLWVTVECAALMAAAGAISAVSFQRTAGGPSVMPPTFVVTVCALLLAGPDAALLVAAIGAATPPWKATERGYPVARLLGNAAIAMIAVRVAGLAHTTLGGTSGALTWPWQAVPLAAAALAYHLVESGLADVAVPLVTTRSLNRAWAKGALQGCSTYLVGAGLAAAAAEAINRRMWALLPVAMLPVVLVYRMYADYVARLEQEHRDRQVVGFRSEGVCVVDRDGRITFWDQPLERLLECPVERAVGRLVVDAVASLRGTDLPRAMKEALADRTPRTIPVRLVFATRARLLSVQILPGADGLSLVWHDVTDRTRAEGEQRRTNEWLATAAEAANDALWEWDTRTRELYVTGRWWEMLGLAPRPGAVSAETWFERVHPEDMPALKQTLERHLSGALDSFQHEHRLLHEDGSYRRFVCRGLAVKGPSGRRDRIAGSVTDTTEQTTTLERLQSVGVMDSLTGLCTRDVFVEGLGRRLEQGKLPGVRGSFAVLYVDIDRFKIVNDSLGHLVGDELLTGFSRRLEFCLREGDALARLGGDEFAILLDGLVDDGQANAIAFRIQESLREPFSIGGREVFTSASIGIAFGPAHYTNPDDIMRDADTAMYHAKSRGKARHEVFDAVMDARVRDRLSLENDLRRAVANHEIEVHYQPIVALTSGMCVGFESLVRWNRAGEPVSPATFIPIAEELGLIEPLGTWVLQRACETFADWQRRFPDAGLECITVNVSSRQLMQHNFLRLVQQAVEQSGVKREDLRVEITETALMDNPGEAAELLRDLRKYGVKVYLDDFGTGYSSLSHLHQLPVDALKIDRSFVKSLLLPDRPAIVESILALARTLKTSVVAEGIESPVQAFELERLGCTHAQGFLFSRPLSAQAVETLLTANVPLGPKAGPALEPQNGYWPDMDAIAVVPEAAVRISA
jgi:diguanylate cyclase (GGDEF)-like protein/PAS domain S-box-containing protein